ncbi:MAG: hypothetical protein Q7T86_12825 [Hyphomicrobiaceae bacterium]|nr:hypothetical protein [Hyphomicrobiaceae bacterium]
MGVSAENERLKYKANFLSNLSVVVAGTGALAPIVGSAIGANPDVAQNFPIAILVGVSLLCGCYIYVMGLRVLDAILDD